MSRNGWKYQKIMDVCEFITSGGTPSRRKPNYWNNGNIPWVKTQELRDSNIYSTEELINDSGLENSSARLMPVNTVSMAMYGATVGKLGIFKKEMTTNQACCNMVVNTAKADYRFLYYALLYNREKLICLASGAAQQNLNQNVIKNYEVLVPTLSAQKQIVKILGDLDEKIEMNHQMNKTFESIVQAVFKKWFVEENDSPETVLLSDIIDFDPPVSLKKGQEAIYVDMAGLSIENMAVDNVILKEFSGGAKFQNGDTLLARITPCLENGKTAFVNFLPDQKTVGFGSTEFIVMRAKKGISPQFVYCLARDEEFRSFAIKSMVGSSGRQRVQRAMLENYEIIKPNHEKMEEFHRVTEPMFNHIGELSLETIKLKEIRDFLLPKMMAGEVAV